MWCQVCANHTLKESSNIKARDHTSNGYGSEETGDTHSGRSPAFSFLAGGGEVINDGMD